MQQSLSTYGSKGQERNKMLIRWVVALRRHCLKISEVPKYLQADHIEPVWEEDLDNAEEKVGLSSRGADFCR